MSENRYAVTHPKVKELQAALERIGWGFRACGCGYYQIQDHRKRDSAFQVSSDYPRLSYNPFVGTRGAFGEKRTDSGVGGAIQFWLSDCEIEVSDDLKGVNVFLKGQDKKTMSFLSFYNFDN